MNPQALELNEIIQNHSPAVFKLLGHRGKRIFFPKKGILAQTAEAKGKKINATIGAAIEDDGSPMRLKSIEKELNIEPQLAFPYAPSFGRPDLRKKWKELIVEKNPELKGKPISTPVVSQALTHGLSIIGYLFLENEEEIIVSDFSWGNYNLIFNNAYNAELNKFNLFTETGFDLDALQNKMMEAPLGKKFLILNFPNNPTGYTPTKQEIQEIVNIIKDSANKGNRIIVVIDDAYFGLVYEDGIETESIFSYLADLHENVLAVKIDGATKEDYAWGFRVGFITYGTKGGDGALYKALEAKTAGAIRGNISNASNLSQSLLLKAYNSKSFDKEKSEKFELLKSRYNAVKKVFKDNPNYAEFFTPLPFNSGYFMCIKLDLQIDGEQVRQTLLKNYDTGIINTGGVLRIAFSAAAEKDIPKIYSNIFEACKKQK